MITLWLLVGTYIVLAGGVLIAAGLAPEGHEDERGFHLGKPLSAEVDATPESTSAICAGCSETVAAKGVE